MKQYFDFIESYADFLASMVEQESKKHSAMIAYDLEKIDQSTAQQQAMMMRLEKMEQQRLQLQSEAGFEGLTFKEILERLGGEERIRFEELYKRISRTVFEIKYLNSKSLSLAKMNLEVLGMQRGDGKGLQQGYTWSRTATAQAHTLFDSKI